MTGGSGELHDKPENMKIPLETKPENGYRTQE